MNNLNEIDEQIRDIFKQHGIKTTDEDYIDICYTNIEIKEPMKKTGLLLLTLFYKMHFLILLHFLMCVLA